MRTAPRSKWYPHQSFSIGDNNACNHRNPPADFMGNRAAIVPFDGRIASPSSGLGGRSAIDTDYSGQKAVNLFQAFPVKSYPVAEG
jgi:hypothetical protein